MNSEKNKRPPIISILGHIDHGKSTLLKAIRDDSLKLNEAGNITQHIGAYEIEHIFENEKRKATIIDTPGHEAFAHIKENSVNFSDIAILVISAEDGWKEQTEEAFNIIKKKNMPYIVAFTKIDKVQNYDNIKYSLSSKGILLEGISGDVPWIGINSIDKTGIKELVEIIFLTADVYETSTKREDNSIGILIEASIDTKKGIVGTLIVQNGKIKLGDFLVSGNAYSPIRIMEDDRNNSIKEASESKPVKIYGWNQIPKIELPVFIEKNKKSSLERIKKYNEENKEKIINKTKETFYIPIIVKADTIGGLNSVLLYFQNIKSISNVFLPIKEGVGEITEDDVRMASINNKAKIIGFHTKISPQAKRMSENLEIECKNFDSIYQLTDWIKSSFAEDIREEEIKQKTGTAKIIRIFKNEVKGKSSIIGIQIEAGSFALDQKILIERDGKQIGIFFIKNIEQRNNKLEIIEGAKQQFAAEIVGEGLFNLDDKLIGLSNIE